MQRSENRSEPLCIITGLTGAGKTTLLNLICGTNHETGAIEGSMTKLLFRNRTNVGDHSFDIIDTPGTDSPEQPYEHAYQLSQALTACPMNTIFIILQYSNRFQKIIENYMEAESTLFKYKDMIVVMISHWDQSKQQEKDHTKITKLFRESCSQDKIIFFSSTQDPANYIANKMCNYMSKMPKKQLEFTKDEFLLKFNIYVVKLKMYKAQQQCFNQLSNLDTTFRELALQAPKNLEEKDDFLHSLLVAFKDEIELLEEKFLKEQKNSMQQLEYNCLWISLSKKCLQVSTMFSDYIYTMMSYDLNDNQDPRNLIKKCPNCGEIWFKTEGCDGKTSCGNVVSNFYDILTKPWTKFKFIRNKDGKFDWKKIVMKTVSQISDKPNEQKKSTGESSKKKGCGAEFVWRDQAKLDESLIIELFQVKTIEEVKTIFKKKDFKRTKHEVDKSIDTRFYS